jgi:hypothetical protein
MKRLGLVGVLAVVVVLGCDRDKGLKKDFVNPPLAFRMNQNIHNVPMDAAGQDSMIESYLRNGYGGFASNVDFNHYLTDEGMASFTRFSKEIRRRGMSLWLYDEQGYPSGNAGDKVIKTNPAWESMGLYEKDTLVEPGELLYQLPPGELVKAAAYRLTENSLDWNSELDLQQYVKTGKLNWSVPVGNWRILVVTKYRLYENFQACAKDEGKLGANYPSLMLPEVTQRFIELTHEAYRKYLGDDLGAYFVSTFTDEPSLMAVPFGMFSWSVIPWIGLLSDEIQKRYGYRPEERSAQLFLDEGEEGEKVRYQYFSTMAGLIVDNYFKPIKEWCRSHHFKSGGHLLLEETLMAHVPLYGDAFRCMQEMDAPGIDVLSCFPSLTPVHSPKLASSAAELSGANRVMCEPCPVADRIKLGGPETPAANVRGFLNIQLAGGVTDFNNYLQLSNSTQAEKNEFNTYVARISMLLRGGYTKADIAVVYPAETMWTKWIPEPVSVSGWDSVAGGDIDAVEVEQAFRNVSRFLYQYRWEYAYIDSKAIIDGEIKDGKLIHGQLQWKVIILPGVNTLPIDAWKKLEQFTRSGGIVISLNAAPENSESRFPDETVVATGRTIFNNSDKSVILEDWSPVELHRLLMKNLVKDFTLAEDQLPVRYCHRMIDGKDVYFLFNDSDKIIKTRLAFGNKDRFTEWDPATGTTRHVNGLIELNLLPFHGKIYRQ